MGVSVDAGCLWKEQEEYERDFFFRPRIIHITGFFFLSIYSLPHTVVLAGDKEMKNIPSLRELSSRAD